MIAAQVLAGLDGLQRRLEPGPATEAPYVAGATALPTTLAQALDALAADTVLQRGLGPAMAAVFERIKRQEIARHETTEDKLQQERRE